MRTQIHFVALALAAMTLRPLVARTEIVYHPYEGDCPCIDFDGDGVAELSFTVLGVGNESGGVIFLTAQGPTNTHVLAQNHAALPLQSGDLISASTPPGQWDGTDLGISIWRQGFNSVFPGGPIIIIGPGGPVTNPPAPPPLGEGVGMPGYGNFFGARFLLADGYHYGWVRLNLSPIGPTPSFNLPGVLDYAYETNPDTPILAGAGLDSDHDGIPDSLDQCPDTPAGEPVNSTGCSISQIVPCDGPWKNHGDYVKNVGIVARNFAAEGLITQAQLRAINRDAANSDCGKNQPSRGKGQSKHGD